GRVGAYKAEHVCRPVLLAAGIGAFEPAKLANESVARFEGKGVVYLVSDLQAFAGQRVLIIGGGDSAVDWALALDAISEKVTLIHRREGFRAHDSSANALTASSLAVRVFNELRELRGDDRLRQAVIFDNRTQEVT